MFHVIANLKSGKRKTKRTVDTIRSFFENKGVPCEFHFTEYPKHCTEIVRGLSAAPDAKIIAVGGDGTFHEALNGVVDLENTTLGFVPSGSGNDFAAFFKPLKRPLKKFLADMLAGKTMRIDFIQFAGGQRCLNVAGTGLDIEVLLKAKARKWLTGNPNYIACLVRVLKRFDPYILTVTSNGKTETYSCIMAGLANGRQIGGGIRLSPRSSLTDGKLNLVIMKDVPRKKIKWILPGFIMGKHLKKPYTVHEVTADTVKITNEHGYKVELDGEIYSNLDFEARVVPQGLKVFC